MVAERTSQSTPLGVAISSSEIAISSYRGESVWRGPLPFADGSAALFTTAALADGLRDALRAVRERADTRSVAPGTPTLRIALLAPLADVRMVALPPVNDYDARRLLVQSAPRYFLDVAAPLVVGVAPANDPLEAGAMPSRVACAVSADVLGALHAATRDAGFHLDAVVPAVAAWCRSMTPGGVLLVKHNEWYEVIEVTRGAPRTLRRFASHESASASAEAQNRAAQRGYGAPKHIDDPLFAAARALAVGDASAPTMHLVAEGESPKRSTPLAAGEVLRWQGFAALAVVLLGATPLAFEWGDQRKLASVRAERSAMAQALAETAPQRLMQQRLQFIDASDSTRLPASRVLSTLSDALSDEAWVARLRLRGDSVFVEGRAQSAARTLDELANTPLLDALTVSAPVRRETSLNGEPVDRFEFTLSRLRARTAESVRQP